MHWPFLRKIEVLLFTSLVVAVPLFAWRILELSRGQRELYQVATMLVGDLRQCQTLAHRLNSKITIDCMRKESIGVSYLLIQDEAKTKTIEIRMPFDVNIKGSGVVLPSGLPDGNLTFTLNLATRETKIQFYKNDNITISKLQF